MALLAFSAFHLFSSLYPTDFLKLRGLVPLASQALNITSLQMTSSQFISLALISHRELLLYFRYLLDLSIWMSSLQCKFMVFKIRPTIFPQSVNPTLFSWVLSMPTSPAQAPNLRIILGNFSRRFPPISKHWQSPAHENPTELFHRSLLSVTPSLHTPDWILPSLPCT